MNLVIVGESRSGKSQLANLLCTSIKGFSKISLDYLIMTFKNVFPELEIGFSSKQKGKDNLYLFLEYYFGALFHKEDSEINYVVEGGSISNELLLKLKEYPNTHVICLGKTKLSAKEFFDETRLYENGLSTGGWTKRLDDKTLLDWCGGWIKKSKDNKDFCEKNGIMFFDTSYNFKQVLNDILKLVKKNTKN